jgi:integrase
MAGKITLRNVEAHKTGILWDGDIPGFGLRVVGGGARVYVLKYRAGGRGGRQRWLTIGRHGAPWTPASARDEVRRLLGVIASGGDPAATREATLRNPTFADFTKPALEDQSRALKAATSTRYRYLLDRLILPRIGSLRVAAVTRDHITDVLADIGNKPGQVNLCLAVMRRFFALAEVAGHRPGGSNPCRGVPKAILQKRERFLTSAELAALGKALAKAEQDKTESPLAIAGIRLLLLTGARRSEIVTLQWRYVDFERRALMLPDSKTGAKPIYLNAAAVDLLRNLPKHEGSDYVLASTAGRPIGNIDDVWRRMRSAAGLAGVRLHDLRHTYASVAAMGGYSLPVIGALLGHARQATTERYAHLAAEPIRAANDAIGEKIAAAMTGVNLAKRPA